MSDELLHTISIDASLGIERFYKRYRLVYRPAVAQQQETHWHEIDVRRQVMRLLESLGYCEIDYDNRRVYMLPATMVLLPSPGTLRAFLTGSRVPEIITRLQDAVKQANGQAHLVQKPQGEGNINMPTHILIEAVDRDTIKAICHEAYIEYDLDHNQPAAWRIAHLSISAKEIEETLRFSERQEPNWPKRNFNVDQLRFEITHSRLGKDVNLAEYRNPVNNQYRHWLWKAENVVEVERDWARYLILAYYEKYVLLWDEHEHQLAVPVTVPLPRLLARAATLSSGIQPTTGTLISATKSIPQDHAMLVYHEVFPEIAKLITNKLSQELVPVSIQTVLKEVSE